MHTGAPIWVPGEGGNTGNLPSPSQIDVKYSKFYKCYNLYY